MAIQQIDLSEFKQYTDGDTLPASEFNAMVALVEEKLNEIVTSVSSGNSNSTSHFYVNGIETNPIDGIVHLETKKHYTLQGTLHGRVVIGDADEFFADADLPSLILLDNCTVITDSEENSALEYAPEEGKCIVTIKKNTINHLVCTNEAERADSQKGALHANHDLFVQGSGYLSCVNHGGHGIKASEIHLNGNPHIYCQAIHDGIHGNKYISITGGVYYIYKSNDAFGTRAESGTPGTLDYKAPGCIHIFGGEFFAYGIQQAVFDSKGAGYIFSQSRVMNTKDGVPNTQATGIVLHTDVADPNQYVGVTNVDPETYFGAPIVSGFVLSEDETTYTATGTIASIKGYFSGKKFVFPIKSSEVTLNGAYIEVVEGSAINYTYDGKNIKVKCAKDTVSIIKSHDTEAAAINSINNIAFEAKNDSCLVIDSVGPNVSGSEITFRDGYGSIVCNGEIIGSQINFGEPIADAAIPGYFGGSVKADRITARLSGKGQKGNFVVSADTMLGVACCDTLTSAGTATMANTEQVNYYTAAGSSFIGDTGRTIEPYDVVPSSYASISSPIPSV